MALAMCFPLPVVAVFSEIRSAGGGVFRYLLGLLVALALACVFVVVNWKTMNFISRRAKGRSERTENLVGVMMLAAEFAWGILSFVLGFAFAAALVRYVGR
jgi:hypothetical protein